MVDNLRCPQRRRMTGVVDKVRRWWKDLCIGAWKCRHVEEGRAKSGGPGVMTGAKGAMEGRPDMMMTRATAPERHWKDGMTSAKSKVKSWREDLHVGA